MVEENKKDTISETKESNNDLDNKNKVNNSKVKSSKKPKKQIKKKQIIQMSILISVSIAIGVGGGILFFNINHTETGTVSSYASEGKVLSRSEMRKKLDSNTDFVSEYEDKAYELINYSLHNQAEYPYSLTVGTASVNAVITQNIKSTTYTTPEVIYNQNVSESSMVHTANRFYDYKVDNKVECYLKQTPDQWTSNKREDATYYSYDEYIQLYGKLLLGSYYCTASDNLDANSHPIADVYLTDDEEAYKLNSDITKHHVNGVIIYMIGPKTVKSSTITKNESGYKLTCELYTDKDVSSQAGINKGNSYYAAQMRTTGGLSGLPPFTKTQLEFQVDDEFNLVSSFFYDEYKAPILGGIEAKSEMTQYYFHSESSSFNGVEITVPTIDSIDDFKGYNLMP